jgi:hypothetical protein
LEDDRARDVGLLPDIRLLCSYAEIDRGGPARRGAKEEKDAARYENVLDHPRMHAFSWHFY